MLNRIFTLIIKEFQTLFSSAQSVRILIVPVILQVVIYPLVVTMEVKNCTVGIFNQDTGAFSAELVQRIGASPYVDRMEYYHNDEEAGQAIDLQKVMMVVRIPSDFSSRLSRSLTSPVQTVLDGRHSNSAQIVAGYLSSIVGEMNGGQAGEIVRTRALYNPALDYQWFILPCLVALITSMSCLMLTALSLAREKEKGSFEQLLVSPLTPLELMTGKIVPGSLIALVQGTIVAVSAVWVYGVPFRGSLLLLYAALTLFAFAMSGVGLFISSLSNTQQQAFIGLFCFLVPAMILSGFVSPIDNMPVFLQYCTQLNPLTHIMSICKGVFLKGYGVADVYGELFALWGIGFVTSLTAYVMIRVRAVR